MGTETFECELEVTTLGAKPAARFCVEDQARLERQASQIKRAP